ncbi:FCD domain-containing protein [Novosphingobium sp. M1R2S20]|uniref:Pyruvate dehydrogenase complex repressor n=1 Tax=Novosphingobium rhizovicinum TaxID=3228928 RepID=A0ABV3REB1_9SPHN
MPLTSIRPAKLADAVADHIQELILEGALPPGERLLPERELAVKLDVSRPSLREGLEKLIERGLLETDANGACYISKSIGKSLRDPLLLLFDNPQGRFDCMEFRAAVEAEAARLAAQRASSVDRATIERHFRAMEAAHEAGDVAAIAGADGDFHFAIYAASHNVMVLQVMRSLEDILRSHVHLNRQNLFEHRRAPEAQLAEHRAVFDAIMAGDPDEAERAARQHMVSTMRTQREIHEEEQRLMSATRRLARHELLAPAKGRERAPKAAAR